MRLSDNPKNAQYGNSKMEEFIGRKNLTLNLDKSNYIVVGNSTSRRKMKTELNKSPLTICGVKMDEVDKLKYLGDTISFSNDESIHKTITRRIGVSKFAIVEIRSIIEDSRASILGGINVAFDLFESCVVSSLLHNAETWDSIPKKTMKIIDDFFNNFLRRILRVCTGTPIPNLYWHTGFLKADKVILQKKLLFLHHLSNLPEGSLGREFFDLQQSNDLVGLVKEMKLHLEALGVSNLRTITKHHWKNRVKAYIKNLNKKELIEDSKRYKKINLEENADEEFKRKDYFSALNLEDVRMKFKIESKVVPTIRNHFKRKYRNNSLKCPSCRMSSVSSHVEEFDTSTHVLYNCPTFRDQRMNKDFSNDQHLVDFFKFVIEYRMENNED